MLHDQEKKKTSYLIIVLFLCTSIFAGLGFVFVSTLDNLYKEQADASLAQASSYITRFYDYSNKETQNYLTVVADAFIEELDENPLTTHTELLNSIPLAEHKYLFLGFISTDGDVSISTNKSTTIEFDNTVKKLLMYGEQSFYATGFVNNVGQYMSFHAIPVQTEDGLVGRIFCGFILPITKRMLLPDHLPQNIWYGIVNEQGILLDGTAPSITLGNNVLHIWSSFKKNSPEELQRLTTHVHNGREVFGHITLHNTSYYVSFTPTQNKNWMVMVSITQKSIHQHFLNVIWAIIGTGGVWLLFCIGILTHITQIQRRERKSAEHYAEKLQNLFNEIPSGVVRFQDDAHWTILEYGSSFLPTLGISAQELEEDYGGSLYNLVHPRDRKTLAGQVDQELEHNADLLVLEIRLQLKDKRTLWVLMSTRHMHDDEGGFWFWAVVTNITERKISELHNQSMSERYKYIFEASDKILYEYDWNKGELRTTVQFFEKFGYRLPETDEEYYTIAPSLIHEDDVDLFNAMHLSLQTGKTAAEALVRIKNANDYWVWCQLRQSIWTDSEDNCLKAIGEIRNVDEETRSIQKLRDDVQRDSFTGLYNKTATTELIQRELVLEETDRGVLCIIDVDNFKQVNDTLGHARGDAVIKDLASGLARIFRSDDIVGRVGGDEYIVYIKNMPKLGTLLVKLDRVLAFFNQHLQDEHNEVHISCSIGIALFPKDGPTYQELYQHADKALYRSKKKKGIYTFYDPKVDL